MTMTPFSTEKESAGRPAMVQSRTSLGSARKEAKSNSSEAGRFRAFTCKNTTAGVIIFLPEIVQNLIDINFSIIL